MLTSSVEIRGSKLENGEEFFLIKWEDYLEVTWLYKIKFPVFMIIILQGAC